MHLTIISFTIRDLLSIPKSNQFKSNVGFWREGKTGVPGEKPLGAEKRTNKLSPLTTPSRGIIIMTVKTYGCHMDPYLASLGRRTYPGGPKANNSIASKIYT